MKLLVDVDKEEFAINILEQYREKPTLINEIETVEEIVTKIGY